MEKRILSDAEWKKRLSAEEYRVLREKGTERAFTGRYHACSEQGVYVCAACGNPLFSSDHKFDSGTGWPSFKEPISCEAIECNKDVSLGMERTEVTCARCESHLGHVFPDGPPPTYQRYCMNSISLNLIKEDT